MRWVCSGAVINPYTDLLVRSPANCIISKDASMRYGWDGSAYNRLELPHMRWGNELLSKLELSGRETILEVRLRHRP